MKGVEGKLVEGKLVVGTYFSKPRMRGASGSVREPRGVYVCQVLAMSHGKCLLVREQEQGCQTIFDPTWEVCRL